MKGNSIFDRLDPDQAAAVRLRRNGTVSAGAGSGKTTVLAARYLDLLIGEGAEVRSILCLTFTRKAAAEMRARVYRELKASGEGVARAQLERFAEASISTIDSFCGSLLRSSAQDYGYAPSFAVDDEAIRELAEAEALRFLLSRREEAPLRRLFSLMGFERAWKALFAEAAYRFAWPCLRPESDFRAMPARARAALEADLGRFRAALREALSLGLDAGEASTARGRSALALLSESHQSFEAQGWETPEAARALRELGAASLAGFGRSEAELLLKEALKEAREAARRLRALASAAEALPLQAEILGLLADFAEEYREAKRRAGIMGFRDVAVAAVDLLSRRPELRAYWKRRYRYIMVDEFQDDDELQKELLFLLAEEAGRSAPGVPRPEELAPDKLFFVGDDKQSIYRFRGAEVSVFNRLGRELAASRGLLGPGGDAKPEEGAGLGEEGLSGDHKLRDTAPRLRTNYRSEPALLGFFNELFSRVLAGEGAEDYEARFEEALPRPPSPGIEPSVRLLWKARRPSAEGKYRSADEALAEALVRFLKREVGGGRLLVPGEGGPRPAVYDDCAILLRSTAKQYILERFLRLHGLPYAAASVRGLFVESPANDLYAALRLALLPEDRVAYAALLRSPFVGLSDDAFVLVLGSGLPPFDPGCLGLLEGLERERYERGARLFAELGSRIDRLSLAELLSFLWYEGGLRLSILRRPEAQPYLEHYDYLFALAARADAAGESLAAFIGRLEPLMGRPEKLEELEAPREAGSGIKLMSIHKSKGLEFPLVLIPWIEGKGRAEGPGEAFYLSEEAGLSLNLRPFDELGAGVSNVFFERARELEDRKSKAEIKRLLYVACTRASAHLVLAAVEPRGADLKEASFLSLLAGGGGLRGPDGGFASLPASVLVEEIPELSEEDYRRLARRRSAPSLRPLAAAYRAARELDRSFPRLVLPATALQAAALAAGAADAGSALEAPAKPARALPASVYDDFAERVPESLFGELCHAALEARLRGRPLRVPEALLPGLPEDAREPLLAEAERLAALALSGELGKRLARGRASLEAGILLPLGPYTIRCRLDLLLEDEEGFLVLDWKSGREARAADYEIQMALYRRAAQALDPRKPVSSYLVWLRSGEAEELARDPGEASLLALARIAALGEEEPEGSASNLRNTTLELH